MQPSRQILIVLAPLLIMEMEIEYYNVSGKLCDAGHVCLPPKECCSVGSMGCCHLTYPHQIGNSLTEMFKFLFWYYWYLWIAVLAGLLVAAFCGFWFCRRRQSPSEIDESTISDRVCYYPAPYTRCSSTMMQALPPPYNEVTAKPDLYPLVIDFDDGGGGFGKDTAGFVMRCFRSLSRASTLDSLSSSFMCNVVNEANTIIPPPYSCNNSIDELSTSTCNNNNNNNNNNNINNSSNNLGHNSHQRSNNSNGGPAVRPTNFGDGSLASLANQRTTSDISSIADVQSPLSPPRATSPTNEIRELLEKIQQLPHQLPASSSSSQQRQPQQNRPKALFSFGESSSSSSNRTRRTRGKSYIPVGPPPSSSSVMRSKSARYWLSRSAPTTPSGATSNPVALQQLFMMGHHHHHHHHHQGGARNSEANRQQAVPLLLDEQDESEAAGSSDGRHRHGG